MREGASEADVVTHKSFSHDWSRLAESSLVERRAIEAIGAMLGGSSRPFIVTSGVALLEPCRLAIETGVGPPVSESFPRASEAAVSELIPRGVRAPTIRLAPSAHGMGDHGFVQRLAVIARENGVPAYVGEELNRGAAMYRLDAARVYRLAMEKVAAGPFYAIGETRAALRTLNKMNDGAVNPR